MSGQRITEIAAVFRVLVVTALVAVNTQAEEIRATIRVCRIGIDIAPAAAWALVEEHIAFEGAQPPVVATVTIAANGAPGCVVSRWEEWVVTAPAGVRRVPCLELEDVTPVAGDFEAFVAGTMGLVQFLARNPDVGLRWTPTQPGATTGVWSWTNERRECFSRATAQGARGAVALSDRYETEYAAKWGYMPRLEVHGPGDGGALRLDVEEGARFTVRARAGNVGLEQGGANVYPVLRRYFYEFDGCDVDMDGRRDAGDLAAFFAGGMWDWNRDGRVDVKDGLGLAQCVGGEP
jgi:hypothetical protein